MLAWLKRLTGGRRTKQGMVSNSRPVEAPDVRVVDIGKLIAGTAFDATGKNTLASYATYLKFGTSKIWASWKAVDLIAQVVQDTPWKIARSDDPRSDVTAGKGADLAALLQVPNEWEVWGDILYKTVFHLRWCGVAYWAMDRGQGGKGRPTQLWALNPKLVKQVIDPVRGLIGYVAMLGGQLVPFDVDEIMYFRRPHPNHDFAGLGDMEAGEELLQDWLNRQDWQKAFWKNGAAPLSVMILKPHTENPSINATQFEELKLRWHKEYGGGANAGKIAWLTGQWEKEDLGVSPSEMQNLETSRWTIEQIFMLHGIPLSVAGLEAAANYATARIDDIRFRRYAVKPTIKTMQETINSDLVPLFADNVTMIFELSGLSSAAEAATDLVPLFERGALSLNELREAAGFEPIEDDPMFESHYIAQGLVPLDLAGATFTAQQEEAENPPEPEPEPKPKPGKRSFNGHAHHRRTDD